jgi:hypothetical protein
MTRMIDRLQQSTGAPRPNAEDRRAMNLELTAAGELSTRSSLQRRRLSRRSSFAVSRRRRARARLLNRMLENR